MKDPHIVEKLNKEANKTSDQSAAAALRLAAEELRHLRIDYNYSVADLTHRVVVAESEVESLQRQLKYKIPKLPELNSVKDLRKAISHVRRNIIVRLLHPSGVSLAYERHTNVNGRLDIYLGFVGGTLSVGDLDHILSESPGYYAVAFHENLKLVGSTVKGKEFILKFDYKNEEGFNA